MKLLDSLSNLLKLRSSSPKVFIFPSCVGIAPASTRANAKIVRGDISSQASGTYSPTSG